MLLLWRSRPHSSRLSDAETSSSERWQEVLRTSRLLFRSTSLLNYGSLDRLVVAWCVPPQQETERCINVVIIRATSPLYARATATHLVEALVGGPEAQAPPQPQTALFNAIDAEEPIISQRTVSRLCLLRVTQSLSPRCATSVIKRAM